MSQSGEMTFWDHLEDLRKSIFRMLAVFMSVTIALFFFKEFLFEDLILAPSKSDFFLYRILGADVSMNLVNIDVAAQFMIHMKVTFVVSLILVFPYFIYEVWRFISPALYMNEKKAVSGAFAFASALFYAGVAIGYTILFPLMLNFFAGYQVSPDVPNHFALSSYISLLTSTVITFGIVFEFPTVVALLSGLGILDGEMLRGFRRYALLIVVILAAVITPSGDPFSLMVVSVPLYLLYEFSILVCRKRKTEGEE